MDNINYTITEQDLEGGKSPQQVIRERQIALIADKKVYAYYLEVFAKEHPKEFQSMITREATEMAKISKDPDCDLSLYQVVSQELAENRRTLLNARYYKEIEEMAVNEILTMTADLNKRYNKESN